MRGPGCGLVQSPWNHLAAYALLATVHANEFAHGGPTDWSSKKF